MDEQHTTCYQPHFSNGDVLLIIIVDKVQMHTTRIIYSDILMGVEDIYSTQIINEFIIIDETVHIYINIVVDLLLAEDIRVDD